MHYVYHPHHEPIVVSTEEYPAYLNDGWYDSPAKFPAKGLAEQPKPIVEPVVAEPVAPVEPVKEEAVLVPKKFGKGRAKGLKVQL